MQNPFRFYKIIRKFRRNYPWYKKIMGNIIFFIGSLVICNPPSTLTPTDRVNIKKLLEQGDILLVGNLKVFYTIITKQLFGHAAIFCGDDMIIHSYPTGVEVGTLGDLFARYDTALILRIPKFIPNRAFIINRAITYAQAQLNKPYDFELTEDDNAFYCTKFVFYSLRDAGYDIIVRQRRLAILPQALMETTLEHIYVSENAK